jgi:hypothetical protein
MKKTVVIAMLLAVSLTLGFAALSAAGSPAVAKVVFVDLEKCCKCTASNIGASWDALQEAVADTKSTASIERLHMDTQAAAAAPYRTLKAPVAMPAVYFLDADGKLIELLQGQITTAQAANLLAGN